MEAKDKRVLRALSLELRHILEGRYDDLGIWHPGDLERRLNEIGIWREREAKPLAEMPHLSAEDKAARQTVDAYLKLRDEAGVLLPDAVGEFVRESAYTWANRLFALRCMEARGIIDEVILQKEAYSGRSMVHNRFARKNPDACSGEDDGLFAVLLAEFTERSQELPRLFNPRAPAVALRPSAATMKKCVALLSGRESVRGQDAATDALFEAHDAFGWAYQYWNSEAKDRVFEKVRTQKGAKIEGADIIPATQLYTEPYMVKFLVQNSVGALWMCMHPESKLCDGWEYYVKDADRSPADTKSVGDVTFLDPAEGSGHFHLEAFDLFYAMYEAEGVLKTPDEICAAILNHNLFGIDIDERAVQISMASLWMKAKQKAPDLAPSDLTTFHDHHVATNIRLPKGRNHLEAFLEKHPEDEPLRPALDAVFQGMENAHELGSLLQIEEPVEMVLRQLQEKRELAKPVGLFQPNLFETGPVQQSLPIGIESYEEWKAKALDRLSEHFHAEAEAADPAVAFFGQSAGDGLTVLDVLARRYDVVAANPPYMGSKNMPAGLREYVEWHYEPGKRDVYAAFMLRATQIALPSGRIAFVAPQSWMFLKSYAALRAVGPGTPPPAVGGLLARATFEVLAQLGRHAFSEVDPPCNVTLVVWSATPPRAAHRMRCFRISAPRLAEEQSDLLRRSASGAVPAVASRPLQVRFLSITNSPLCFWLSERLFEVFDWPRLGEFADVRQGLATTDNPRFLRCFWEAPAASARWVPYAKGGGYRKWVGFEGLCVEWGHDGARVKEAILRDPATKSWSRRVSAREYYFRPGLTYTLVARGGFGVRLLERGTVFDVSGTSLFPHDGGTLACLSALCNARISTYLLRVITQSLTYHAGYVAQLPIRFPNPQQPLLSSLAGYCCLAKDRITATDLTERRFGGVKGTLEMLSCTALLATAEGCIERVVMAQAGIGTDDAALVFGETGKAAGLHPLLRGYDHLLEPDGMSAGPGNGCDLGEGLDRCELSATQLASLRESVRQFFAAGPSCVQSEVLDPVLDSPTDGVTDDDSDLVAGACIPIPAESILEEISVRSELHPVSVYWLLKEGIETEGWRCIPEEQRLTADRSTVTILRLLGHRWPKQIEAGQPVPEWADKDGVIPISEGTAERTLLDRVRERIAADFPGGSVQAIENEFQEIMGEGLAKWLSGTFFARYTSQFKRRPIAWQVQSQPVRGSVAKGRKKGARGSADPAFSCLVYYHKLDADMLPKIHSQYVGPLITKYQTELRTLESTTLTGDDGEARKWQLQSWIDELRALDSQLSAISATGFATDSLRQYAIDDAMLSLKFCWLDRLRDACESNALPSWQAAARTTGLHADLPIWIAVSVSRLPCHCSAVTPSPPRATDVAMDPTVSDLAELVCMCPPKTVREAIALACAEWWNPLDEAVFEPMRREIKDLADRRKGLDEELKATDPSPGLARKIEIVGEVAAIKAKIKELKQELERRSESAKKLRECIEGWHCPEAEGWQSWLAAQPLYDQISSIDSRRPPPLTVAEWVRQESQYAPDINDGVRVNIAPLQKAGVLAADVLAGKELNKAIADRADWRSDERRWVREGKLSQPGWWQSTMEERLPIGGMQT